MAEESVNLNMSVEFIHPDAREKKIEEKPKDPHRPVRKH